MKVQKDFFKSVKALPDYLLEIEMRTDTYIIFDFKSWLGTARFGALKEEEVFNTAHTDGFCIQFREGAREKVTITAGEFADLLLGIRIDTKPVG
ncbi:MAG: hypothetical protein LBG12_09480 [Synergistaceae bacterium]|jgi:hypothetical protein|nr:hypothetical protein [Synergistaceae bacterium]